MKLASLTVYYDGSSPVCRLEFGHFRGQPRSERLEFIDVSNPEADTGPGLPQNKAMGVSSVSAQGYGTGSNPSDHYVGGYTTGRGTYVEPHYQTNPNSFTYDNYETRGNYNPHTGGYGTRSPY